MLSLKNPQPPSSSLSSLLQLPSSSPEFQKEYLLGDYSRVLVTLILGRLYFISRLLNLMLAPAFLPLVWFAWFCQHFGLASPFVFVLYFVLPALPACVFIYLLLHFSFLYYFFFETISFVWENKIIQLKFLLPNETNFIQNPKKIYKISKW